MVVSVLMHWN